MFILYYGQDSYRSLDFFKKAVESFKQKRDPNNLNTLVLDCTVLDSNSILEQMLSLPFLAEKKMLALKNLLSSGEHSIILKSIIERIEEDNFPKQNDYIFWEEKETFASASKQTKNTDAKKIFEILKKQTYSREFTKMNSSQFNQWLKTIFQEKNIKIKNEAINYLIINAGDNLHKIEQILDQISFYKNGQEIETKDLVLFLEEKIDDNIFNLVDNIFSGQKNKAYKMLYKQYEQGKDISYIFAMILRQVRIFLEIRDLLEREDSLTSEQIAKKTKLHPFVVKKSIVQVKKYNKKYLQNIYNKLLAVDIKIKNSLAEPKTLLDFFINEI